MRYFFVVISAIGVFCSGINAADTFLGRSLTREDSIRTDRSVPVQIQAVGTGISASISTVTVSHSVRATSDGDRVIPSIDRRNRTMGTSLVRLLDVAAPTIQRLSIDGQVISTGDYISYSPVLNIVLEDADTTVATWNMVLSNSHGAIASAIGVGNAATVTASLTITNPLASGVYSLEITVWDSEGNHSSRVFENLRTDSRLKVTQLIAGPNPFNPYRGAGAVEYQISDTADVDIKILSMSGRTVWHQHARVAAGFNRLSWDGRDLSGDIVANGPYLVVVVAKGESETVTGRYRIVVVK